MWKTVFARLFISRFAEYGIVAYLLLFWFFPRAVMTIEPGAPDFIEMLFMFEFLFGHASVGLGVASMLGGKKSWAILIGMSIFYGMFFIGFVMAGYFVEVLLYLYVTVARIYRARKQLDSELRQQMQMVQIGMGFARVMLLLLTTIPAMLPWPSLGLGEVGEVFEGGGMFVEYPGRLMMWLILYFSLVNFVENLVEKLLFAWGMTQPFKRLRRVKR